MKVVERSEMEGHMLHLPIQAAPVARSVVPSALTGGSGVEASDWRDIVKGIGDVAGTLGPILGGLF